LPSPAQNRLFVVGTFPFGGLGDLETGQFARPPPLQYQPMAKLIFRCTRTALNVQVWLPDEAPTDRADSYEAVTCPACTRLHLVNKTTGKMLSDKEK
jgi:hypothetical protein